MDEDEAKQFLEYLINESSNKIRLKCNFIYLHDVDDNNIRDLNELINQFLTLRKIREIISHNED